MSLQQSKHLIVLLLVLTGLALAQDQTEDLWQQAVEHFSDSMNLVPGDIVTRFELLNGKGEPEQVTVTTMHIFEKAGDITSELVSVIQDGEDITEKAKEERENEENDDDFSMKESVFHPDNQQRLTKSRLPETRNIKGRNCAGFEYTIKLDEETRSGTVWINTETGLPVENHYSPDPLPKHVKKLESVVTFSYTDDNQFYVDRIRVEGRGGILFIQKDFRMEMVFSEYWKKIN